MFNYKSKELIGKNHDILIPLSLQELHRNHSDEYFKTPRVRRMGIGLDLVGIRSNKTTFPVEISLSFINTANEVLVFAMVSDITVRKQTENTILQNLKEISVANESLKEFSYFVSHDLKAPLSSIIGFTNTFVKSSEPEMNETTRAYVEHINHEAIKMTNTINGLITLAGISHQEIILKDVNLSNVILKIINDIKKTDLLR
ncbi:MAG: PAS domain S-box protein, partial [Oligoflexia bacterium]|nr:PAS domain S-box protein [Oligoflexia bacterium]